MHLFKIQPLFSSTGGGVGETGSQQGCSPQKSGCHVNAFHLYGAVWMVTFVRQLSRDAEKTTIPSADLIRQVPKRGLKLRTEVVVSAKHWQSPTRLQGVTNQKTIIRTVTTTNTLKAVHHAGDRTYQPFHQMLSYNIQPRENQN